MNKSINGLVSKIIINFIRTEMITYFIRNIQLNEE